MYPFLLTTDSGCDLPLEYCEQNDVTVLRMTYELDGVARKDTMRVEDFVELYEKMAQNANVHTSAINIEEYLAFWRPLLEQKLPIVHIAMGSGISCSYQNACLARETLLEEFPDAKLFVIDSLGACMAYGIQVMHAVQLRNSGMSAEDCTKELLEFRHHVHPYYTTANLEYLYRGGRVSRAGMVVAHTLNIRPILNLNDRGELRVVDKCRGVKKTYQRICDYVEKTVEDPQSQTLYVLHANARQTAEEYAAAIMSRVPFKDVSYAYIGTTIGAHTGPGLVAAFYCGKPRMPG